jgi:hypothetical protein
MSTVGRFDELLESATNPGEGGIPDSIYDDLRLAHGDELAIAVQERDGANTRIQELEGRISQLQTQLYDQSVSAAVEPDKGADNSDLDPDDEDDEDDVNPDKGVDSLFGDK